MTYTAKKKTKAPATEVAAVSKKKLSLGEFRAWLSGVEEMQSDDWTPDSTQWRRIRAKIEEIVEGRSFKSDAAGASSDESQPAVQYRAAGPSFASEINPAVLRHQAAQPPSFVATGDMIPKGAAGGVPMANVPRVKTPTIDTSGGNYSSALE